MLVLLGFSAIIGETELSAADASKTQSVNVGLRLGKHPIGVGQLPKGSTKSQPVEPSNGSQDILGVLP